MAMFQSRLSNSSIKNGRKSSRKSIIPKIVNNDPSRLSDVCIFETNPPDVAFLIEKIKENKEELAEDDDERDDFDTLVRLIQDLLDDTMHEREIFEEEFINFHVAKKRLVDFPKHFRTEMNRQAETARDQNFSIIKNLRKQRKSIEQDLEQFENEGRSLTAENKDEIDHKDLSDKLMGELVNGLNERMSQKAQNQIQLNKTLEEIQKINVEIDLQPGKLEDLEVNIGGEITELKMKTDIALHHSQITAESNEKIKDELVDMKAESEGLRHLTKEKETVIGKLKTVEGRVKKVCAEAAAHGRIVDEKESILETALSRHESARQLDIKTKEEQNQLKIDWQEKGEQKRLDLATVEEEFDVARTNSNALAEETSALQNEIGVLEASKKDEGEELAQLTSMINEANQRVHELLEQNAKSNDRIEKIKDDTEIETKRLNEELDKAVKLAVDAKAAAVKTVATYNALKEELNDLRRKLTEYNHESSNITKDLEDKQEKINSSLSNSISQLERAKTDLSESRQTLATNIKDFNDSEKQLKSDIESWNKKLADMIKKIKELRETLAERTPPYEQWKVDHNENEEAAQHCTDQLKQAVNKEKQEIARIKAKEKNVQEIIATFKSKKSEKAQVQRETIAKMADLSAKITHLDKVFLKSYFSLNSLLEKLRTSC